jgi:hypothetical protein
MLAFRRRYVLKNSHPGAGADSGRKPSRLRSPRHRLWPILVVAPLTALLVTGCTAIGVPAATPAKTAGPDGSIAWDDAVNHVGTSQRVCGPLAGSGTSEDDVFLDLGVDYPSPDRFQIVIWDVGGVDSIPFGSTVCTTGPIALYNGVPEIALHSASEVEIYK